MTTVAQFQASMKRYNARPGKGNVSVTMGTLRKAWCGSAAPVYEALYADGARLRFTLFQIPGKPYDFERGREIARRAYHARLVNGWIHHALPGEQPVTMHDSLEPVRQKQRTNYKALLQKLVEATKQDNLDELEAAWHEANMALA